jgi:uncharacterized ion transporter superfamily protein YfcC
MRSFARNISFPSAYAVLMLVIVLGAALTWMLPANVRFDRWLRFIWPLLVLLAAISIIFLATEVCCRVAS